MKKLLLFLGLLALTLLAIRCAPLLLVPAVVVLVSVGLGCGVLLALATGLCAALLLALVLLSPLWIPILAVCGLIALVKAARQT